jgi:SAM-dependent methyltransferase
MTSDADRIVGLYQRHAATFARDRTKTLFERPWLDRFTALLPAGGTVLDVGCGTGEPIAGHLVRFGYRVTGVDSAPRMIDLCRLWSPDGQWQVADMRRLALGRQFDGILAWDSLFHLNHDDQRGMFPIFRAHAAAGCALMFTSGPAFGEAVGTYQEEPLYHASLDPGEYRALLAANGFTAVAFVPEDPECGGRSVWLARRSSDP